MTIGADLPCPKCGSRLDSLAWRDENGGQCRICRVPFDFIGFPALGVSRPRIVPKAVLIEEHATCFHHPENQAEAVCEGCGRFLCSVCAIDFGGRLLCPGCIKAGARSDTGAIKGRTLYDGITMSLALYPLLFFPFTLLTAPVALGVAITSWRKPRSLVGGGRTKLVVAGLLATAQIAGWVVIFTNIWLRRRH
jgi:hypothetical protein